MLGDLGEVLAERFERRLLRWREPADAANKGGKRKVGRGRILVREDFSAVRFARFVSTLPQHCFYVTHSCGAKGKTGVGSWRR